jgi:putative transposase
MKGEAPMNVEMSVTEAVDFFKQIQKKEKIFEMIRFNVQEEVGKYLTQLMDKEMTHFLGRERYERKGEGTNHRNGGYHRDFTLKRIGEVKVKVPRDRAGQYQTQVLPRSKQYETALSQDLSVLFLTGISTRSLSLLSNHLLGRTISHTEISQVNKDLADSVERWRQRDLSQETIKYLFVDGVHFAMRMDGGVENIPVLVAIGVTEQGNKLVLGLQMGDKESAGCWREFCKDLKRRGLDGSKVVLGIMDGLPGLEKVFKEEFPQAQVQRCQVHVARNVLAKVPQKLKQPIADEVRSIFYASSEEKAREFFRDLKFRWENELPSAIRCLEQSLDSCLTFFKFPKEEWISLRTTNLIERLNKEFKRRIKPMEIVAGEASCYRLLAFISLKMELHWRSNPVGKVRANLPFYKNFTQIS